MEFALFNLMSLNHAQETPEEVMATTIAAVQQAEALGFDATWFAEHHFTSASVCASPLMMAAHCAALTRRIRLGPAVVVLPLHHPLRVVQEVGMLNLLSGGRLNLGIGTGHQPHEFRSFGVNIAARTAILSEAWDILEQGLRTGVVNHSGVHFQIPPTPICIPGTLPPLFLAGGSPELLARAARSGATPLISQGLREAEAALPLKAKAEAGYRAGGFTGRDIPLGIQRYVFVTNDAAEQRAAAEGLLKLARTTLSLRDPVPQRDGVLMRSLPYEGEPSIEWLLERAPIGPAEKVARILAHDMRVLRPSHMSLYMGFSGLPQGQVLAALERLGRDVLPHLRRRQELALAS
ncbi:LLM class flavin-dependent oxidoreductase [Sediminicoccus sp. KRV36]|uniref:LLM class flavin-dependent oxidoreductase n=1 Tax=Sediminicoccus sp. KRV36 TaxID=3133721 RepID=UPI00200F8FFD|nr:LLM class flavin-dependent oxidoreductase [Sediminicoccus rosea]UPY35720.1 LLM class flavin-dependent oxidoreductase [Sediminicoccus rosea]